MVRPGYKKTEIGVIPEDWTCASAREICVKIQDGTHFSPKLGGVDFRYVTSKNIRFGSLDLSSTDWISRDEHEKIYRRCDVKKGDLLLTKDGASTGNAALHTIDEEISLLSSVAFLRFDCLKHDVRYFLQQILSIHGQQQIAVAMAGNAITRLTLEKINNYKFIMPPTKAEQEAIAEALSDADGLIEALEQLIAKKRAIKQGAMQELLTGKKRLPRFEGEWETKKLGEVAEVVMGQSPSSKSYNYKREGLPLIQGNADISDRNTIKRVYTTEITKLGCKGDILMSVRAPVGEIARATFDVCLGRGVCAIRFSNHYLYHALIAKEATWAKLSKGSTFDSVNSTDVKTFEMELPVDEDEQTAIATVLSDMDAEIAALEAKLSKARQVKQGMMQELLTGRIRLV